MTLIDLLLSVLAYYAMQMAGAFAIIWVLKGIWEAGFFLIARVSSSNS